MKKLNFWGWNSLGTVFPFFPVCPSIFKIILGNELPLFCSINMVWSMNRFWIYRLMVLLWGICMILDRFALLPDAVYPSVVIMGCMPCGLNTIVFPILVGEDCKMGAKFVLLSHVLCLITIPLWMWILTW